MTRRSVYLAATITLCCLSFVHSVANAQTPTQPSTATISDADEAARRKIMESDRWRQMIREFNEWLTVQQAYTPEQLVAVRSELSKRTAQMSPRELEAFLSEMEARLDVLLSPAADDARQWLSDFFRVARNPEAQLGRQRPDVLNMSASEIRREMQWLDQHRASRMQAQAAFNQGRAVQTDRARGIQDSRRQARDQAAATRTRAAEQAQVRSQYAPHREDRSGHSDLRPMPFAPPIYSTSPWGSPIYWNPLWSY